MPPASDWMRGGGGHRRDQRSAHVRVSDGPMAVFRSFSAVRAVPWLWRRAAYAAAGLRGLCPGKGYAVGPAQVRTAQVSRSTGLW